ncbi:hypothetical protein TanjilG_14493 [Lupinus angustifolius]|uniref:Uncharacterized protein n=1 Tax=Lupinus angustifolius TaxID=3871 RepID=A0A4P1RRD6_LUPAN|nr:hypothetical protein TanjilG_14493 [Lupinus angustifolius]
MVESPTSFSNHRVTIGCKKPHWHDDRRRRRRGGPRIHPPNLVAGTTETPSLLPSIVRTKMHAPIAANVMNNNTASAKPHPRRNAPPHGRVNPIREPVANIVKGSTPSAIVVIHVVLPPRWSRTLHLGPGGTKLEALHLIHNLK